jgi:hypothetical protein
VSKNPRFICTAIRSAVTVSGGESVVRLFAPNVGSGWCTAVTQSGISSVEDIIPRGVIFTVCGASPLLA